ncbi:hypothetical protein T484DRAFT_1665627, partial [Baffinella frigidus]
RAGALPPPLRWFRRRRRRRRRKRGRGIRVPGVLPSPALPWGAAPPPLLRSRGDPRIWSFPPPPALRGVRGRGHFAGKSRLRGVPPPQRRRCVSQKVPRKGQWARLGTRLGTRKIGECSDGGPRSWNVAPKECFCSRGVPQAAARRHIPGKRHVPGKSRVPGGKSRVSGKSQDARERAEHGREFPGRAGSGGGPVIPRWRGALCVRWGGGQGRRGAELH